MIRYEDWINKQRVKKSGNELLVKVCPKCGNEKYKFSINEEKGLYKCWVCCASGKIKGFTPLLKVEKKEIKIPPPEPCSIGYNRLLESEHGLDYLIRKRKIDYPAIKHFKLGLDSKGNLQIPFFDQRGALVGYKFRSIPPREKMFWREPGRTLPLYNLPALNNTDTIYITEGEMDCIMLWQKGVLAMGTPIGAGGWNDEWNEIIKNHRIYIVYDIDEPGEHGAERLKERLIEGGIKCQMIRLKI